MQIGITGENKQAYLALWPVLVGLLSNQGGQPLCGRLLLFCIQYNISGRELQAIYDCFCYGSDDSS